MTFFSLSKAETKSARFYVQLLGAFNEPSAVFGKNGELKFANPEWRLSLIDGKFEKIFENRAGKDAVFRIGKAIRNNKILSEKAHDYLVQVTPLGTDSVVRCLPLNSPPKKFIADKTEPETPKELETNLAPIKEVSIEDINEVPSLSRANLASLIAGAPIGIARLSKRNLKEAQIIGVNPAFVRISKVDSGEDLSNLVSENDFSTLEKLEIGADAPIEIAMKNNQKTICESWLVEDGEKGAAILLIDITERLEMQQRLAHANKMEEIGRLTAGVAHELNNTLGAALLNADNLLQRHPVGDPDYAQLQEIRNTTGRSGNLVKSLLAFSRKQTVRREVLDMGDILGDFAFLLHRVLDERVKLNIHHGRDLPNILADKQQIETMIMNLVTNARDAILGGSNGGLIQVSTGRANRQDIIDALDKHTNVDIPDVPYCLLTVSDTGTGIAPEIAEKIFEPFYTTKESGKGTGIGMASVYGIVKQSGGFIALETEVGHGTTFYVFLPHTEMPMAVATEASSAPSAPKPARNLSGQGRILLVEDEKGIRTITAQILKQRGYSVTEAEDGEEALDILIGEPNSFDLLISDVVMPIMDGPTLLKEGREYLGNARVIFMSGYAEEDFGHILEQDRDISFLPKPFELVALAEKVKEVLSS